MEVDRVISEIPRSLPFSEDGEKGVLCSLLLSPRDVWDLCATRLRPDAFYVPAHQIVYNLVIELIDQNKPIDFVSLKQGLKDRHQLEEIGGPEFLSSLFSFVPAAANAAHYISLVREKWAARTAILDYKRRLEAAYDPKSDPKIWDPDGSYLGVMVSRKLKGASFLDFSKREIDASKTLLGDRYLCRGGGAIFVAPSGHGKSVLAAQAAIELACGLPALGIKPSRPLKSVIVQAEDDDGDIIEMAQIVNHLELSPDHRKLVGNNTHVEFVNDATGDDFLSLCDGFLSQWRADLLWINPYTAYLGADIKDDGENTHFLRNGLNPILTKHDCASVIIHHTPKTNFRDTTNWKSSDWMYSGAGAAVLTNWARAYLVIDPCEEQGVYKFIAAKRGKRIGWGDHFPVFEQYWTHSTQEGQLLWLPANQDQASAEKSKRQKGRDDLLPLIPIVDPISQELLFIEAKEKLSMGSNKVRDFVKVLIDKGKIIDRKILRSGRKSGVGYVRSRGECS
jgi:hypothetical protein